MRAFDLPKALKLQARVRRHMRAKGFSQLADDAAQEFALRLLEGKSQHQTVSQFCIDFLKAERGDATTDKGLARLNARPLDLCKFASKVAAPAAGAEEEELLEMRERVLALVEKRGKPQEKMAIKLMLEGKTQPEIGREMGGVTASRVCNVVKAFIARVRRSSAKKVPQHEELRLRVVALLRASGRPMRAREICAAVREKRARGHKNFGTKLHLSLHRWAKAGVLKKDGLFWSLAEIKA